MKRMMRPFRTVDEKYLCNVIRRWTSPVYALSLKRGVSVQKAANVRSEGCISQKATPAESIERTGLNAASFSSFRGKAPCGAESAKRSPNGHDRTKPGFRRSIC